MHPTPSTSASPAPFRVATASRHADGPSPSKRRKLASPLPSSKSSSNSCQSGSTLDPQLDTERRASSSRVLNVWSALEDKYARRLDEDDIVDLRSGGLVKDRGVLSGKDGTWDIGCFADPKEIQGDDDDDDEIGVWGSDTELDHQFNPVPLPPVRELDPEDAEDLKAFLAAEEARKALQGSDFSEDEDDLDANVDMDESIVEIEVESAPALPPTDSDDELAGFDDTVGEGAFLWEVGTELSNCSEPLGEECGTVPKPVYALPRRNQTPAQLCTPPLSHSSVKGLSRSIKASSLSFRMSPIDLRPPSPPKPRKSSTKNVLSVRHSPDGEKSLETHVSTGSGKEREMSLSPTKNLVAEVMLPMRRANSVFRQNEDARLEHEDARRTPAPPQPPPSRDDAPRKPAQPRPSSPSRDDAPRKPAQPRPSSPSRDDAPRKPAQPRPPSSPHEFWPPYPSHAHTPAPSFPAPYSPPPNHMRESSVAPPPEVQIHIAQAMQSLSYLAFGLPPPPPPPPPSSSSIHHRHPHPMHTPPSSSQPSTPWSYSTPYVPYHSQRHPPWLYPPSSYPYPYSFPTYPYPATPSSAPTPSSFPELPPSPPDLSSSPLKRKGKKKRVSFPHSVIRSESESVSGTNTDADGGDEVSVGKGKGTKGKRVSFPQGVVRSESESGPDTDTDVDGGNGVSVGKGDGKGKTKRKPNVITPKGRSRRDSQGSSKSPRRRSRNLSPRRKR